MTRDHITPTEHADAITHAYTAQEASAWALESFPDEGDDHPSNEGWVGLLIIALLATALLLVWWWA